jgi:hypothetical protein
MDMLEPFVGELQQQTALASSRVSHKNIFEKIIIGHTTESSLSCGRGRGGIWGVFVGFTGENLYRGSYRFTTIDFLYIVVLKCKTLYSFINNTSGTNET